MKGYFKINDVLSELSSFRETGNARGLDCGLDALNEIFSLKKGYPLFIAGAPFSGKTEFAFEILMNTSILYGWKHFVYAGEVGEIHNIFAELVSKHMQKQFHKGDYGASDTDIIFSSQFVEKHFVICNHNKDYKMDDFLAEVEAAEKEYGIKFDTTLFDPFNDMEEESSKYGGRDDKYLANALKKIRVSSKKNNRIDILINHIADVKPVVDKESGRHYLRPAFPSEWSGGQTWWRRAFTMLLVYRPPVWMTNEHGIPFEENETHIINQKAKPKGTGKTGMASIFWDWKRNRYYNFVGNTLLYSCESKPEAFKPINNFYETDKEVYT